MSDDANSQESVLIGVGAVIFRGDEILLIRRGRPPFKGYWSIPGGKLKHGETLRAGLAREVREETGGEIEIGPLIDVFEALPGEIDQRAPGDHMLLIDFVAEWRGGAPVAGDDAAAAEFVGYEEALARLAWDKTRLAIARALEIRRAAAKPL